MRKALTVCDCKDRSSSLAQMHKARPDNQTDQVIVTITITSHLPCDAYLPLREFGQGSLDHPVRYQY